MPTHAPGCSCLWLEVETFVDFLAHQLDQPTQVRPLQPFHLLRPLADRSRLGASVDTGRSASSTHRGRRGPPHDWEPPGFASQQAVVLPGHATSYQSRPATSMPVFKGT
jgi:hypothetical protein